MFRDRFRLGPTLIPNSKSAMASERRSGGNLPSRGEKQSDTITAQPLGRGGKSGRGGGSETTMGENPETVEGDWTVLNFVAASSANTVSTYTV